EQEPNQPENEGEGQEPNEPENEGEEQEPNEPENEGEEQDIDYDNLEFDDEDEVENNVTQEQDFDPDFDDSLVDAVNGIDPNSDEAVEQRAIQEIQRETGTNPQNSQKNNQKQAKRAKLR
ncbi:hypothetical protein DLH89_24460, partial [Vibrio parahaemolyticus]|nr:hypothetical protein [Vibrio parahaemolyticus]